MAHTISDELAGIHTAMRPMMEAGTLKPTIGIELGLGDAPKSHVEVMSPSSGGAVGNIVINLGHEAAL
eukprot:SAG31_NODE_22855_length_516_cov_1.446043_1_plen_68_part_00